MSTLGAEDID